MPSSARVSDLLNLCKTREAEFEKLEMCAPDSMGFNRDHDSLDIGLISKSRCFGCLCCLERNNADSFDPDGVPSFGEKHTFSDLAQSLFQGRFVTVGPNPNRFIKHSMSDEKVHTTPIAANLLLFLSRDYSNIFVRCSPSWELSIDTADAYDPREGHLDLTVVNCQKEIVLVAEVKASVHSLLGDKRREQWSRYRTPIFEAARERGFISMFTYIIGGDEYSLYPSDTGSPMSPGNRTQEFFDYIIKENKYFMSLESLRALKIQKMTLNREWSWEKWLWRLFSSSDFLGLVSGGVVDRNLSLHKAPWL